MPIEGEIRQDRELGLGNKYIKVVWLACATCGRERWVRLSDMHQPTFTGLCHNCLLRLRNGKGQLSPNWKGGIKYSGGYIYILLSPDSPFYAMANEQGYVKRARLIIAQHLGRCLTSQENVHHEDGIKTRDVYENLRLFPGKAGHTAHHRRREILLGISRPRNPKGQFVKEESECQSMN